MEDTLNIICQECRNLLVEDTTSGELIFRCSKCGQTYESTPEQTLIEEKNLEADEQLNKFSEFLDNAAFDPTNLRINKTCTKCHKPYMTPVRIGENQLVFYVCTCGYKTKN